MRFDPIDLSKKLIVDPSIVTVDRLTVAMLFPKDHGDQAEFFQDLLKPSLQKLKGVYPEEHSKSVSGRIVDGTYNGVLAGTVLMYFRSLQSVAVKTVAGKPAEPSLNVVSYLCEVNDLGRTGSKTRDSWPQHPKVTRQMVRNVWHEYQRVAHLWAAYIHLVGLPIVPKLGSYVLEGVDISVLLFLARQYERFVDEFFDGVKVGKVPREKIVPLRARYVDWNKDDVFPIDIPKIEEFDAWVAKTAGGYRSE